MISQALATLSVDGRALCAWYHVQRLEADIAEGTGGCLHPADSQCSCCQKDYCARPTRLEGAIKEFWGFYLKHCHTSTILPI